MPANATPSLGDLSDGPLNTPADGQVLAWNEGLASAQWATGSGGTSGPPSYSAENRSGSTLSAGAPVSVHFSGVGVVGASAADGSKPAVGLVQGDTAATFAATVQTDGPLTIGDWSAVTGTATLAARATYYLDTTTAGLTTTPPSTGGQVVQRIGVAVSPTTLEIRLDRSILL